MPSESKTAKPESILDLNLMQNHIQTNQNDFDLGDLDELDTISFKSHSGNSNSDINLNTDALEIPKATTQTVIDENEWASDINDIKFADDLLDIDLPNETPFSMGDLESFDIDADWSKDTLKDNSSVGFVSGAVGMEEPLEAKLDLAKMYLDIEDVAAARETLNELIVEADGEIQAEARKLLANLN